MIDPKPKNVPPPVPIPEESFEEFLEWTPQEEEEFLRLFNDQEKGGIPEDGV